MQTLLTKEKLTVVVFGLRFFCFLLIDFVCGLFLAGGVDGGEFSQFMIGEKIDVANVDVDCTIDQTTLYLNSDKINSTTIKPQFWNNINPKNIRLQTNNSDNNSLRTWVSGFGNWTSIGSETNSDNVSAFYSSGFAVGMDKLMNRCFLLGVTFGWDKTTIKPPSSRSENFSAGHGHAYFRTTFRRLYVDVESGIGLSDGTQLNSSGSKSTALQWNFQVETGTWWDEGLMKIEPFMLLQHATLFREDLSDRNKSTAIAGVRCSWKSTGLFSVSTPRIYGGFIRELGNSDVAATSLFSDSPTIFVIQNRKITKTRIFGGCGTTASMGTTLDIYFRYTAEAASRYTSHTLLVGMNWIF
ncbi:MAG: autotransporter outer membrane beta-barrel domain-containing protein [Planctomycetaceae bacterium]|jgi:uncharacterized protein with beta-barrel porin domain|nr:autotransporter outer membrane beta-barrel domain-containing protein [Planctomycetaceae bacterium]